MTVTSDEENGTPVDMRLHYDMLSISVIFKPEDIVRQIVSARGAR